MTIDYDNLKQAAAKAALSPPAVLHALELAGLHVAHGSPLGALDARAPRPDSNELRAQLSAAGLVGPAGLEPGFARALETLARPAWQVQVISGDAHDVTLATLVGPADLADRSLVAFRRTDGDDLELSWQLSKEHVVALLAPALELDSPTLELPQTFDLSATELVVVAGISDAWRQAHLEALLDHHVEERWELSRADLLSALQRGFTFPDTRWLVPVAQLVAPFAFDWNEETVTRGLAGLLERGLIARSQAMDARYTLSRDLELFCGLTAAIKGFGSMQLDELRSDGSRAVLRMAFLRAPTHLWVLGFTGVASGAPDVTLFSADASFVANGLADLLRRSGERAAEKRTGDRKADVEPGAGRCPACGTSAATGARFCAQCATPLAATPAQPICSACGEPSKADSRFCARCGTPVAASTGAPAATNPHKTCRCGAALAATARFCKRCGETVMP